MKPERKARSEDIFSQKPSFFRLLDGKPQPADSQRILGADIDISFLRAHRIGRNHHAFYHLMRIAFHDASIHKCARIPLIAIADHVPGLFLLPGYLAPLVSGLESAASPAS